MGHEKYHRLGEVTLPECMEFSKAYTLQGTLIAAS